MELSLMDEIMEAFHLAARLVAGLPNLPDPLKNGMLPILCTLRKIQDEEGKAKVTDISKYLKLTSPGVIRLIGQCEKEGMIEKWKDTEDKRVTNIRLTEKGKQVLELTMDRYHAMLAVKFSQFDENEWKTLIKLMNFAYDVTEDIGKTINYKLPDWKSEEKK